MCFEVLLTFHHNKIISCLENNSLLIFSKENKSILESSSLVSSSVTYTWFHQHRLNVGKDNEIKYTCTRAIVSAQEPVAVLTISVLF